MLHKAYNLRSKNRLEHLRTGLPPPPKVDPATISRATAHSPLSEKERLEKRADKAREAYQKKRDQMAFLGQAHQTVPRLCLPGSGPD